MSPKSEARALPKKILYVKETGSERERKSCGRKGETGEGKRAGEERMTNM